MAPFTSIEAVVELNVPVIVNIVVVTMNGLADGEVMIISGIITSGVVVGAVSKVVVCMSGVVVTVVRITGVVVAGDWTKAGSVAEEPPPHQNNNVEVVFGVMIGSVVEVITFGL